MPNSEGKKRPVGRDKTTQKRKRKPEYTRVNVAGVETMEDWGRAQEEKYGMLVQNIPCAVYSACPGKAGPTTFMSNKWKDWTGYSPEELYQDPEAWARCIHRDDREHAVNTYIEACRDRMAYNLEYRIVHKDTGQLHYVRDQGHLSKDEKGAVVRVDGIVTDITELKKANNELDEYRNHLEELVRKRTAELTSACETLKVENKERKRAEQALSEIEREKSTVLENLSDLIVYRDKNMVTLWASKSMANWHGMSQDQIIGRVCYKARYGRDEPCEECHIVEAMKSGQRQELEKQLPGERCWHVIVNPVFSDSGQVIGAIEFSQDITERKRADKALRQSEEKYRKLFEGAQDGIMLADAETGIIVDCNRAAAEMLDRDKSELVGLHQSIIHPPDKIADGFSVSFRKHLWKSEGQVLEEQVMTRTGRIRDVAIKANLIQLGDRKLLQGAFRDVTEQKQSEEALQASEGKLSAMLQSIADPMSMMDRDLNIIWANEKAMNIFGDDIVGRKCYEAYHGRNKPCEPHPCLTLKVFKDGMVHEHNTQVVDKDGKGRSFHCSANVALRDEQGKPTAVLEISKDITDQKHAEQALRESESSYRAVVENAVEGIVVVQGDTLQFVNPALVSMIGYSEEELLTRPFIEFIHPDHRDWAMGIHIKRLKGEEVPPVYEFKILDKKGNVKWLENNGILIEWHDRPATLNFLRDITDQKLAKEQIERLAKFPSENPNPVLRVAQDGKVVYTNDPGLQLLAEWKSGIGKVVPERWRRLVADACKSGKDRRQEEEFRDRVFSFVISPVVDSGYANLYGSNITERKRAEENLKYRIEFEQLITILSKNFIDPGDIHEKINGALKAIGEFANVDRAYVFQLSYDGRTVDNTHEWCAEGIMPQIKNLKGIALDEELPWFWEKMKANETFHVPAVAELPPEAQLEKKHFEMQDIQALVVVPMLSKGILNGFLGFDSIRSRKTWPEDIITLLRISGESISLTLDREHAEQRARLLSSTVEQSSEGMGVIDLQGNLLFLNNAFADMHGYAPEELVGSHISVFHTPEQMPSVEAANRQVKETGKFDGEIWHVRRDGTVFPCLMHNSLLRDEAGNPIGLIGAIRDITESKRAEQALKESEERLKILFESAPDAIYLIDSEGRFMDANRAAFELIGFTRDEAIGKSLAEMGLLSDEQLSKAIENLKKAVAGKLSGPNEYTLKRKDGSHISVEVRTFPVKIGGKMLSLGIARDITEHKRTEKKLLEHQAKLKSLASQLSLTEERERRRLATDLHDQISQSLVISKIKLDQLRKSSTSDEFNEPLEDVSNCLGQIIDDTRALTFDLSYPILYELGFEAAVAEWLTDQIQEKHGIRTEFVDDRHQKPLDDDIRVLLFRNVRELLINVVKHAQANKVRVSIRKVKDNIRVSVEDDGVGFDPVEVASMAAKRAEFGLFSIRERLEQLGGLIEIDSEMGYGSKITMTAPLKYDNSTDRTHK